MNRKQQLGHRAVVAYTRLAREVASLNYVMRRAKPSGMVGDLTLRNFNHIIHTANRLFARERDLPRFLRLDPNAPLTVADFAILVTRLSAALLAFEERYVDEADEQPRSAVSADGLPSPHA